MDAAPPPNGNSSMMGRTLERIKKNPVVSTIVALGAAVTFAVQFHDNLMKLLPQPDPAPIVRVQYYWIGGDAVSLMLLGKIDGHLKTQLGGRPLVWQNPVYRATEDLHRRIAQPLSRSVMYLPDPEGGRISEDTPVMSGAIEQQLTLDPASTFSVLGMPATSAGWSHAFVQEMTPIEIGQGLVAGELPASSLRFSRLVPCPVVHQLLVSARAQEAELYGELVKRGCGTMKLAVTARYQSEACGEAGWQVFLHLPQLSMTVLVVQNISGKPITINKIVANSGTASRVGDGTLLSEDRLVIPLSLSLQRPGPEEGAMGTIPLTELPAREGKTDKLIKFFETRIEPAAAIDKGALDGASDAVAAPTEPAPEASDTAAAPSEPADEASDAAASPTEPASKASDAAASPTEPASKASDGEGGPTDATATATIVPRAGNKLTRVYQYELTQQQIYDAYGDLSALPIEPVSLVEPYNVAKLEVNGIDMEIHPIAAGSTYITDSVESGSCPHLYVTTPNAPRTYLGKVLVGRDSKEKFGVNRRHLKSWPDVITVVERDPEITYLHGVKAVCEKSDGSKLGFAGRGNAPGGGWPVVMARGDEVPFSFPALPPHEQCTTMYVEVQGYYVPVPRTHINAPAPH